MTANARLVVEIAASIGSFREDMGRAAAIAEQNARRIESSISGIAGTIRQSLAAVGVGLSAAGLVAWSRGVLESAENLHNLSLETGSTVEDLSKLSNIAKVSGTSFDYFRTALDRLAAGMAGGEEATSKTADALKFLGVTAKDPATALTEIAIRLDKFADSAGKAAILRDLFGRGGIQMAAAMHAIAESQDVVSTTTTEQNRKAIELLESMRLLEVESHQVRDAFLNDIVPPLEKIVGLMADATRISGGFFAALGLAAHIRPFASTEEEITRVESEIADLQKSIANTKPFSFLGITFDRDTTNLQANVKKLLEVRDVLNAKLEREQTQADQARPRAPKPPLPYTSQTRGQDPALRLLEARLKAIDAIIDEEKETIRARDEFLNDYYERGDISLRDYYAKRQEAIREGVETDRAAYAEEIQLLEAFIANGAHTDDQRASAQVKLVDTRKKLYVTEQTAARESVKLWFDEQKAALEYSKQIDEVTARLLELQGQTAAASRVRLANQDLTLRLKAIADNNHALIEQLDATERLADVQARLTEAARDYSRVQQAGELVTRRIDIARQSGAITELDALAQQSGANKALVPILRERLAVEEAWAKTLEGEARTDALLNIERQKVAIDELAASTDLVARKFNESLRDPIKDGIAELVLGTKNLRDSFRDVVKGIESNLVHLATNQIFDKLFGKGGGLAGAGDFLAKAFGFGAGSASEGAGAAAATASVATLAPAATSATAAIVSLAAASSAAAAALAAVGASSFSSAAAPFLPDLQALGLGSFFPGFASGGSVAANQPIMVGERGPELFRPRTAGTIIPNHALGSRRGGGSTSINVTNNYVLPGAVSRDTQDQLAVASYRGVTRALRRHG